MALKALAGVALIGAAAALASNPVLLPISVISGRRKRSTSSSNAEKQLEAADNYALTALLQGYIQPAPNEVCHFPFISHVPELGLLSQLLTLLAKVYILYVCV